MKSFKPHNKKCRNTECGKPFWCETQAQARATWCSTDCALAIVKVKRERAAAKKAKQDRAELRAAKEKAKPHGYFVKKAQEAFNAWVREDDHDQPCISCGRHHRGQWHAGHYRTVGANPELRFVRANVHKQCAPCNNHKSGDIVNYRINLVSRIGADTVAWLEGPHAPTHYSIDELVAMAKNWRALTRELVKAREGRVQCA